MTDNNQPSSGEQRYRAKRNKFIRYFAVLMLGCMVLGAGLGFASELAGDGILPAWIIIGLLAVTWILTAYLTWDYFHRTDELDVGDNLWAALFGFYFYVAAFPSWFMLHDTGITGPPQQWPIWVASMAVFFIFYVTRKLGLR